MHLFTESPKAREYKSFECSSCSYKADVFGEIQKDHLGTYETFVCLNCKILIDTKTEDAKVEGKTYHDMFVRFTPIEPKCLCCDESNLVRWDAQKCLCPKCNGKMNQTRLELNVSEIGTVKIF